MDRKLSINPAIKQTSASLRNDWRTSSYSKNEHFINSAICKDNRTFSTLIFIPVDFTEMKIHLRYESQRKPDLR